MFTDHHLMFFFVKKTHDACCFNQSFLRFLELCPGISGRRMPKDLSPLEPAVVFSSEHLLENLRKTWEGFRKKFHFWASIG